MGTLSGFFCGSKAVGPGNQISATPSFKNVSRLGRTHKPTGHEPYPNAVVEASLDSLNLDTNTLQLLDDLLGNRGASLVRILVFVVVRRESVEIVDQICVLCDIDTDLVGSVLPVGRKDNYRFWLDFRRDLLPYRGKFGVGRVGCIFYEIRTSNAEKVDRCP